MVGILIAYSRDDFICVGKYDDERELIWLKKACCSGGFLT